jgi:hypothetical protein
MNIVALIVLLLMGAHAGVVPADNQGGPIGKAILKLSNGKAPVIRKYDGQGGPIGK